MENIIDGTKNLKSADIFVGETDIHNAVIDQTKVLNKRGNIIAFSTLSGIKNVTKVIPKYATSNPPKIEHKTLNKPIFLPFFSGVIKS